MDEAMQGGRMVTYQFDCDDDLWRAWKRTVPREQALDDRIRELLAADRDGRVVAPETATSGLADDEIAVPDSVPATVDDAAARAAIQAAVELVRERGPIQRAAIAEALAGEHALGYDRAQVESRKGAWWRKTIRPALKQAGAQYVNGRGWSVDD